MTSVRKSKGKGIILPLVLGAGLIASTAYAKDKIAIVSGMAGVKDNTIQTEKLPGCTPMDVAESKLLNNLNNTISEKYRINSKLDLMGFISQNADDLSRMLGKGIAPRAEILAVKTMDKGQIYALADLDMQKYSGDLFYNTHNKIANLEAFNSNLDLILGYMSNNEFYVGAGINNDIRNAKVDIMGFGIADHSEKLSGPVFNIGYNSPNNKIGADFRFKSKTGSITDILNSSTNIEPIKSGSETKVKLKYNTDSFDTEFNLGQEIYDSNGQTKNLSGSVGFFKNLSDNLRFGFNIGVLQTERASSNYKCSQNYVNVGVSYKHQKIVSKK